MCTGKLQSIRDVIAARFADERAADPEQFGQVSAMMMAVLHQM